MFLKYVFLLVLSLLISCGFQDKTTELNPLEIVLNSKNSNISRVVDSLDKYHIQIKFTQITRKNSATTFKDYEFQVNATNYFYPASTVKFPIAVLTLAKLNTLTNIDRNTLFYIEGDTLETTFAKEIEKIFAVSDNSAYNRLFEFLGQDYINEQLSSLTVAPRISHRLSTKEADEITMKPLIIYENDSTLRTLEPTINTSATPLLLDHITKGIGYYEDSTLISEPFDFSMKNYYPIDAQHEFLTSILFPETNNFGNKLGLSADQFQFLRTAMSTLPKNAGFDSDTYYDGYCKFFMYGDTREHIPEHIKIFNKVGNAYGTLTDCAYIQDTKNKVEFLLTATILVIENGVFNDDNYEYENVGLPFLAELGRALYDYELQLKKS